MTSKRAWPKNPTKERYLPVGPCDHCEEEGPLRAVERKGDTNYYCIPCHVDGNAG